MTAKRSADAWARALVELFILHVEDNADDRTLFQMAAEQTRNPIKWHTVDSADQAINYFEGLLLRSDDEEVRWPDLALLDIVMPLESGTKVLQFLSGSPKLQRLPVIVLTGFEDARLANEVRAMGARSICLKPQGFEHLTLLMDSLYRTWSRARADFPDTRASEKFLVLCANNTPQCHSDFRSECERGGSDISWRNFDSLVEVWSHLQMLIRVKKMETVDWPDLLLLDLNTKDAAGWKLLQFVRSTPEFHGLPVIAFTPCGDRESASRAQALGASSLAGNPSEFGSDVHLIKVLHSAWNSPTNAVPRLKCESP